MEHDVLEDLLLRGAALCYGIGLVVEIIYNVIVLPSSEAQARRGRDAVLDAATFRGIFRAYQPPVLQRRPVLSRLVENGGALFFTLAGAAALAYLFLEHGSWVWIAAGIPLLVFCYFISSLLALFLAVLLLREKESREDSEE